MTAVVLRGDARALPLPDASVDLIVTSVPYWGLRSYTDGGEPMPGQIGSEATPQEWLANLLDCVREWCRVLKPEGSMFVNCGDKYDSGTTTARINPGTVKDGQGQGWHQRTPRVSLGQPKSLLGLPWRLALACTDQLGLILRRDIIWAKPNGLPESVTDRCRSSHEYLFHLVKQPRYYAAVDEIREPHAGGSHVGRRDKGVSPRNDRLAATGDHGVRYSNTDPDLFNPLGKLPGSVWNIPSQPLTVPAHLGTDHFACVDAETEILTTGGWLRHDQLTPDDQVAGYDLDTNTARWTPITDLHRYDYDGELIAVESRDLSMRLTPNHRTIVQRMDTRTKRRNPVSVIRADELDRYHFIPRSAAWQPSGYYYGSERTAAVMGWVAAEGWYQRRSVWLSQSLDVNAEHVAEIDKLISDAARTERRRTYRGRPWTEVTWKLGPMAPFIQREMPDKLLPWWLVASSDPERRAALDAFIAGDGHRRPGGRISIFQKHRHNLDVLQALAVTLGYKTTLREGGGRFVLYLTEGGRSVTLRGTSGVGSKVRREHYKGIVWCPTTGTGTFIARRNGSVFVTGNSFPMELPRRCILGWSPPGICTGCGEGRRPVRGVDWAKVPHTMTEKRALTTHEAAAWCSDFADWCDAAGVSRADLDEAAGTSDMGGWWKSRLTHRAAVPTPEQWAKIRAAYDPPRSLDGLVHLLRAVPIADRDMLDVARAGRNRATGRGLGVAVMSITGYACACPDTTAPTRPALVVDPFGGTGTTSLVASMLGRTGVSIDRSMDYTRLARWRTTDPAERARAMQVPKPPPVPSGQVSLFDLDAAGG